MADGYRNMGQGGKLRSYVTKGLEGVTEEEEAVLPDHLEDDTKYLHTLILYVDGRVLIGDGPRVRIRGTAPS